MSETQGAERGTMESHPYGEGFGPPGSSMKDPYLPPSSNGTSLTDLSDSTHLTLLKSNNSLSLPTFSSFSDADSLGPPFSEMRYIELGNWDLNPYSSEGITARLIDTRQLDSPDQGIQYRPWEKGSQGSPSSMPQAATPTGTLSTNNNGELVNTTRSSELDSPSHRSDKSPITLTPLTSAFPSFSDTFNGPKLPSFQSQFNAFQEPSATSAGGNSNGNNNTHSTTASGPVSMDQTTTSVTSAAPSISSTLPSFHTLPAGRSYHATAPPSVHNTGHASLMGPPSSGHLVTSTTPVQQPFLEDRSIQLFPGQVQLAPAQFGQLIAATSAPAQHPVSNGHHPLSGNNASPSHHFLMTNGSNGINGGGPTTLQFQELVPVPPMQILHPTAVAASNQPSNTNGTATTKLNPHTTDGNVPSLNFNLIDAHHSVPPHHISPAPSHAQPPSNINVMPKAYFQGNMDGGLEAHLIAVKLPPNSFETLNHQQQHGIPTPNQPSPQVGIINQNSPQIGSSLNITNGNNGAVTAKQRHPHTPKRKREMEPNGLHSHHHGLQHGIPNNNNNNSSQNNNNSDLVSDAQVSSVSSTEPDFKRPSLSHNGGFNNNGLSGLGNGHGNGLLGEGLDPGLEKPVKKKRKRCGECIGCQRKDNCGECAPCRNDKSHQICKVRRCEKLTEKKTPKMKLK